MYMPVHILRYGMDGENLKALGSASVEAVAWKRSSISAELGDVECRKTREPAFSPFTIRPANQGLAATTSARRSRSALAAPAKSPLKKVVVVTPNSCMRPPASSLRSSTSLVSEAIGMTLDSDMYYLFISPISSTSTYRSLAHAVAKAWAFNTQPQRKQDTTNICGEGRQAGLIFLCTGVQYSRAITVVKSWSNRRNSKNACMHVYMFYMGVQATYVWGR